MRSEQSPIASREQALVYLKALEIWDGDYLVHTGSNSIYHIVFWDKVVRLTPTRLSQDPGFPNKFAAEQEVVRGKMPFYKKEMTYADFATMLRDQGEWVKAGNPREET